jgi:hypothetical protein
MVVAVAMSMDIDDGTEEVLSVLVCFVVKVGPSPLIRKGGFNQCSRSSQVVKSSYCCSSKIATSCKADLATTQVLPNFRHESCIIFVECF